MNARAPVLAMDVASALAIGLDRWRQSFAWPVSDAEFDALSDHLWGGYRRTCVALAPETRAILLADVPVLTELIQHLHLRVAAARGRAAGRSVLAIGAAAGALERDWSALMRLSFGDRGARARLTLQMRAAAKTALYGRPWRFRPGGPRTWSVGSWSPLKASYASANARGVRQIYAPLLLADYRSERLSSELIDAARALIASVADFVVRTFGVAVDLAEFTAAWLARLEHLSGLVAHARRAPAPDVLMLSQASNVAHRCLALGLRLGGTHIVGFHHGHDMGAQPSPLSDLVEFALCDRFVVPTAKAAEWIGRMYRPSDSVLSRDMIFHAESAAGSPSVAPTVRPQPVRNVMLVGFAYSWLRFAGFAAHWAMTQLDLELRLLETLRAAGYVTLYKAHPEWMESARAALEPATDIFVADDFAKSWRRADAFLFPRITTTAFGLALRTDRPIVLLDHDTQRWNPPAHALLEQRCRLLACTFDERGRVAFDGAALVDALSAHDAAEIDHSYVRTAVEVPHARISG